MYKVLIGAGVSIALAVTAWFANDTSSLASRVDSVSTANAKVQQQVDDIDTRTTRIENKLDSVLEQRAIIEAKK